MTERLIKDPQWYESANCATTDPEIMFPGKEGGSVMLARKICSMCVVREDCLTDALMASQQIGFAGGMSAKERKALKRKETHA